MYSTAPKGGARLLDQERGECGVGRQTRALHVEDVEAADVGCQPDGDVDPRVRHTRGELRRGRRQVQLYDLGLAGRHLAAVVLSRLGCCAVGSRYPAATPIATATATRNVCLDILRLLSRCVDGAVRSRRPCEHRPNSGERTGGDRVRDGRTRQTPVCPDCEPDATFTRPDKSMPLRRAPGVTGRHRRIASPSGRHHDVAIGAVALRRGAVHQGIGRTTVVAS